MPSKMTRRGAWDAEEDVLLKNCIKKYGEGKWYLVPRRAGLDRCRKSCRLRWLNYLKPNIKRGDFEFDEVDLMIRLHKLLGNRWSLIAGRLPGRTANDVKNYWNTHRKKLTARSRLPLPNPPSEDPQPISTPYLVKDKLGSPSYKTTDHSTETNNIMVSKSLPETPLADDGINVHFEEEALMSFAQDPITNFWDNHEIIFPETKGGNTFEEEMKYGWSDIWDLLNE